MSNSKKTDFNFLGKDFQVRLLFQILTDRKFADSIMDIMDANYFEDEFFRKIAITIKSAYEKHESIPDISSLEMRLMDGAKDDIQRDFILRQLRHVKEAEANDADWVQERALKFCKQQELKKSVKEIQEIIDRGDIDDYDKCEDILKRALETGEGKDDGIDVFHDMDSVLADDFRKPIPTGIKGLDDCMDGGLSKGELAVILAPFGVGKAQPLTSKLLTPNGWTTMGDIKEGDSVIGRNGKETKVIGTYPQGIRPIYKVMFNDGTETLCDAEHLWSVNTIDQRNRKTKKNGKVVYLESDNSYKTMRTIDMVDNVKVWGNSRLNFKVPIVSPVEFTKQELIIDPYLLGVILGDGCITTSNQPHFVTKDSEIIESVRSVYNNITVKEQVREIEKEVNDELVLVKHHLTKVSLLGIKSNLIELGLYGTNSKSKSIPNQYLYTSVDDRVKLLQGLVDIDGYIDGHRIEISTTSKELSTGIKELVLSLGGRVSIGEKIGEYNNIECSLYYRISFSLPNNGIIPSKLSRKIKKFNSRVKYSENKFINSIEYYGEEDAQCIMVDDEEHLYVTDDYIVTHNTTMITKVANTAKEKGNNVLQIFFEDNPKVIQRKHLACWSNINLNDLIYHKDELNKIVETKSAEKGELRLKKFPSDGTTIPHIKQYIRKQIARGFRPDIVLIDYIDCVQSNKVFKDSWDAEGNVMRQFETMLDELDMAGWTAVQGNRSSIGAETVDSTMIGGSIKKGQIGHFIVSIAKTLDQKESGHANIAILKSRFGKDGIIFNDAIFDNGTMEIRIVEDNGGKTFMESKKDKESGSQKKVNNLLDAAKERQKVLEKADNT